MSKFAPKGEDGLAAYVVSEYSWGRTTERIEWAKTLKDAKAEFGWTRMLYTTISVRRASIEDVETVQDYSNESAR